MKKNDYQVKKERITKRLNDTFKDKEISELNSDDLKDFILANFKTINRSAYYNSIRILNEILREHSNEIEIDSKLYIEQATVTKDWQYFTRTEVINVCNTLMNFQDKLIVYMLFCGIMGKEYKDILQMKVSDIAEDYSYININGQKFMCDDYMKFLLKGCIRQRNYIKFVRSDDMLSPDTFEFNMSSQYLIKVKPTKRNCNGVNPMTSSALQRKLTKLQTIYESECGEELILSGLSLVKSGIMYDMFMKETMEGAIWTIDNIDKYLKMRNLRINKNELYRKYFNRYHGSNTVVY
jgi:hypothetical protein